jgi:hypothetical protein
MENMENKKRTVGEIDGFINMLRAACEDSSMNETLELLLSQPNNKRKKIVLILVKDMAYKKAPIELIEAISCLEDDAIAEKAYEVIYQCNN